MKKAKVLSFKYLFHDFIRITGIPGLLVFRPKKLYLNENAKKKIKGGTLLIANHNGVFDPLYLILSIWYRRHHFVAMDELFEGKFRRFLFTYGFLCIPIHRENMGVKSFREIVSHLKSGELVSMFPEGHVNQSDKSIDEFKSGMILMALKGNVPIVPVYIKKRTNIFQRLIIGIGEEVKIDGEKGLLSLQEIDNMSKYLYEQEKKLEEMCNNYKKKRKDNDK